MRRGDDIYVMVMDVHALPCWLAGPLLDRVGEEEEGDDEMINLSLVERQ